MILSLSLCPSFVFLCVEMMLLCLSVCVCICLSYCVSLSFSACVCIVGSNGHLPILRVLNHSPSHILLLQKTHHSSGCIGIYSPAERQLRIKRFMEKRKHRMWLKKIKYDVRKVNTCTMLTIDTLRSLLVGVLCFCRTLQTAECASKVDS